MKKTYVLDTNVLIYDPNAIYKFQDNDVVLPIAIIKEIDKIKGEMTERGRNAREVARILDKCRESGSLLNGVDLPEGGKLSIKICNVDKTASYDEQILETALYVRNASEYPTIFVTMDINLRLIAETYGFPAEDYKNQSTNIDTIKNGIRTIDVDFDTDGLFKGPGIEVDFDMTANECLMFKLQNGKTILAREKNGLCKGVTHFKDVMGITARNVGQHFAMEFLMDDDVPLVCISGLAGSGKTLLSSAVGLHKVIEMGNYNRVAITRPIAVVGKDLGFLPGSLDEKMYPYIKPLFDNIEVILMSKGKKVPSIEKMMSSKILEIEPLTYLRGRSLPSQFIISDECQNASPHEIKTLITRCGEHTKLVLVGDITQIDSPYMTESTNGFAYAMGKLKNHPLVASIQLEEGERSQLATLAAEKL